MDRAVPTNRAQASPPPPTLEQRVVAVLENPNAGSEELSSLIAEVEIAIAKADDTATAERAKAADMVACPDAESAQDAIARSQSAALNRDRLQSALEPLRAKYATALEAGRVDRWESEYRKVAEQRAALATRYNQARTDYLSARAALEAMIDPLIYCNIDIGHVNNAEESWDRANGCRRQPHLDDLPVPSLPTAQPHRPWGNGSFAASYAQSMVPPTYVVGDKWSDPEVQAQRRAEIEKEQKRIGEFYEQQAVEQEKRWNEEERARFQQQHRS